MTRREVLAWLAARRPVPPDALRAGIEAVVRDAELSPLDPVPGQLALLGRQMLERVAGRPGGRRELAIELLAADALITYAFEAQAEQDAPGRAARAVRRGRWRRGRSCGPRGGCRASRRRARRGPCRRTSPSSPPRAPRRRASSACGRSMSTRGAAPRARWPPT